MATKPQLRAFEHINMANWPLVNLSTGGNSDSVSMRNYYDKYR